MYDAAIIGAGPIGLACAIEVKKRNLSHLLIDRGCLLNSIYNFPQNMTFFSSAELLEIGLIPFFIPGDRPKRDEALKYYWRVAREYEINLKLFTEVRDIVKNQNDFMIHSDRGVLKARNIILATGYYDNPNMLNVPGEALPHVSHYYRDPHRHIGQRVLIIGGSNSAAINALELHRYGVHVTLVHRGTDLGKSVKYWIRPDLENRIKEGSINALFSTTVEEIKEKSVLLNKDGERVELPADSVLAMTGYHPDFDFMRNIGITMDEKTLMPDFNDLTGETSVPGLYIAGSLRAGRDTNKIFIENGHLHAPVIAEDIMEKNK